MKNIKKTLHLYLEPQLYAISELPVGKWRPILKVIKTKEMERAHIFTVEWRYSKEVAKIDDYYSRLLPQGIYLFKLLK